jgi:predicted DNA-binding transcriptional regulator YafY
MSKRESIARYSLILKKLRKKSASFKEIAAYLQRESELQDYNFNVSLRTFQRDIDDIRSLYNIDIRYDFSKKVYQIDSEMKQEINERIFEAFDTFSLMKMEERLSGLMLFENRVPKGTEHLFGLIHAIKNSLRVEFNYSKFWDNEVTVRVVEPYAVKEFKNRWYLLAKDKNDSKIKSYGLDRIDELEIRKEKFTADNNFDAVEHFRHCFGIIVPEEELPQEVILDFDPNYGNYIKTMALHSSQEIVSDNEKALRIRLNIYITRDFITELMSYGSRVKVLAPDELKSELIKMIKMSLKQYS